MPFMKKRDKSPSSTPVPSTEAPQTDGSQIPEAEWEGMQKVLRAIYDYRTDDDFDPSKLFHRKVNKRLLPEYYDTINEPMAMSTIKQKINFRSYQTFAEFVRDFALIPHNAQVFNRPDSGAFQDALVIKEQVEKQLQLLVDAGIITKEMAILPDLGEIPTYEDVPMEDADVEVEEEEEDSDDEGEEEEEEEEEPDLDDEGRPKRKRGRPRGSTKEKRAAAGDDGDGKRARGRPPKLLTPMEARILAILKGLRKPKNDQGQLIIKQFDRLPDKAVMPEYYAEVKNPMAYDILKRKVKRKKYSSLEAFMADINLMCNNAKEYNQDESQIFQDACTLQREAGRLYDNEKAKPDDTFADEDGKIPMPSGILHNGELYKVGDWIHLQNINDLTKPTPAQVYRTYKNPSGQNMVNVCWYYRPEQTVHRFDKHFLEHEVVKTGRYRDHHIEEVEGRCFIMFYTRYFKGRPRNIPSGTEIYVCKDRYNEERHQFNTIKTWASCLPDEMRDKDYEMDLFDHPRKMKKFPSPIAYLLKDDQKETDDFPKVQWGAEGAPPKIGAVHKRPRTEKDSPPPEPTPPPPPKTETPAPRPIQQVAPNYQGTGMSAQQPPGRPPGTGIQPAPYNRPQPQAYPPQAAPSPAPQRPPSAQTVNYAPATPQTQPAPRLMAAASSFQQQPQGIPPNPAQYQSQPNTASYRNPPPIEVYTLPEHANFGIPAEIREQYQRDGKGHVLFFTTPPVAVSNNIGGAVGGHSVRYLAEKARRAEALAQKRNERDLQVQMEERVAKKARIDAREGTVADIATLKKKVLSVLQKQLAMAIDGESGDVEPSDLSTAQKAASEQMRAVEANRVKRAEMREVGLDGSVFADDWDTRVT